MKLDGNSPSEAIAQAYVRLALAIDCHYPGYVDGYYGPAEWKRAEGEGEPRPLAGLLKRANELAEAVAASPELDEQRRDYLAYEALAARFAEGLKLHMVYEVGGRTVGFIEYIPGEFAWRAVHAPGYLVIHCLWVVGKGKGKGYGSRLLRVCLDEARARKKHGVVMVASDGVWLAKKDIFLNHDFEEIAQAPPSFSLLVQRFENAPLPTFPGDWEVRQARFGAGLTVIRTPQCPYIEDATMIALELAAEKNIPSQVVTFQSAQELQENSPTPYGVFGIVLDGQLLAYHYLQRRDFDKLVPNLP